MSSSPDDIVCMQSTKWLKTERGLRGQDGEKRRKWNWSVSEVFCLTSLDEHTKRRAAISFGDATRESACRKIM